MSDELIDSSSVNSKKITYIYSGLFFLTLFLAYTSMIVYLLEFKNEYRVIGSLSLYLPLFLFSIFSLVHLTKRYAYLAPIALFMIFLQFFYTAFFSEQALNMISLQSQNYVWILFVLTSFCYFLYYLFLVLLMSIAVLKSTEFKKSQKASVILIYFSIFGLANFIILFLFISNKSVF